jgi:hypothetical protein
MLNVVWLCIVHLERTGVRCGVSVFVYVLVCVGVCWCVLVCVGVCWCVLVCVGVC